MSTEQENNRVTLYIATHNKTGKKYFGKTTRYFTEKDLQKYYHGSGVYWRNHIKKNGDDVTMEIYGIYSLDENATDYVEPIALEFSDENNIVEDYNTWANQKEENGLDGVPSGIKLSNEHKIKIGLASKGRKHSEYSKLKISESNKGLKRNKESIERSVKTKRLNNTYEDTVKKIAKKKKENINEYGENGFTQHSKKSAETMMKKDENGFSIYDKREINRKRKYLNNCDYFRIVSKTGEIIIDNIPKNKIKDYSHSLVKTNKNNLLGSSKLSRTKLILNDKEWLINTYLELIK